MANGDTFADYLSTLDPDTAELVEWHLDNGTSAAWLRDVLHYTGGYAGSVTTVKDYRAQVVRKPYVASGQPQERLTVRLAQEKAQREDKAVREAQPAVLTLDIERLPGRFEGDFWDMKSWMNRRIKHDDVVSWPRTICLSWKWLGESEVKFAAEWEEGGHESMMDLAWALYDDADVVVGHNLARFDTKKLRSEWALYGRYDPSPFKVVDTMRVAFDRFGFESNTLDSLCQRFGVQAKVDTYSVDVAKAAVAGDVEAQERIKRYNEGDILATEALYQTFRDQGYITAHPPMAPGFPMRCQVCGSGNILPMDKPYVAHVMSYSAYRCVDCGTVLRGRRGTRVAELRGVKS